MKMKKFLVGLLTLCLIPFGVNAESKTVRTEEELKNALKDSSVTEIVLGADIKTTGKINIERDVTIDGANHSITYDGEFFATVDGEGSKDNTVWSKKSSDETSGAVYVLQAYKCNVTIKNIGLANGNRALGVNGATVTLNGVINVTGNGFQPIELSSGSGVTETSTLKIDDETIILNGSEDLEDVTGVKDGTLYVDNRDSAKLSTIIRVKDGNSTSVDYANGTKLAATDININLLYTVDEGENKLVPVVLFDTIKTNNQILSLARVDDNDNLVYTWEFDGKDITDSSIEVNTNITFTAEAPEGIRGDVTKVVERYQNLNYLNFEHNGKLPGKATISYAVSDKYAVGTKLYVAHFNEATKTLEKVQEVTVDEDGSISFDITECSSYVLYTGIESANATNPITPVKTGDMNMIAIISLISLAVIGLAITSKKIVAKVK